MVQGIVDVVEQQVEKPLLKKGLGEIIVSMARYYAAHDTSSYVAHASELWRRDFHGYAVKPSTPTYDIAKSEPLISLVTSLIHAIYSKNESDKNKSIVRLNYREKTYLHIPKLNPTKITEGQELGYLMAKIVELSLVDSSSEELERITRQLNYRERMYLSDPDVPQLWEFMPNSPLKNKPNSPSQ